MMSYGGRYGGGSNAYGGGMGDSFGASAGYGSGAYDRGMGSGALYDEGRLSTGRPYGEALRSFEAELGAMQQPRSGPFMGSMISRSAGMGGGGSGSGGYFNPRSAPRSNYDDGFTSARGTGGYMGDNRGFRGRDNFSGGGFRGSSVGFRGRSFGNGPAPRGRGGRFDDRGNRPAPSSDAQKSGSGVVWYAGPRCSMIKDNDTGDQVFMYNNVMQPKGATVEEGMEVLYGAFADSKFIKKHNMRTEWEAAWVEKYEEEDAGGKKKPASRGAKTATKRTHSPDNSEKKKKSPASSPAAAPSVEKKTARRAPARKSLGGSKKKTVEVEEEKEVEEVVEEHEEHVEEEDDEETTNEKDDDVAEANDDSE